MCVLGAAHNMSGKENTASTGKSRKPMRPSPMAKHSSKSTKEKPEDVENTNPDGKGLPSAKVKAAKAKARAKSVPRQVMQEKSQQLQGDQLRVKATVVPQAGITLSMSRSLMNDSTSPIKLTAQPVAEETSCISAMEKLSLQDTGSASDPPVDRSTRYVPPSQRSGYSDHSKQVVTDDHYQPDTTVQLDQTESVPQHGSPQTGPQTPPRQYQKPVYAPHSPPAYYHDYHAPYQPMYPPYTPHPIYHDPSVRYNSQAYAPPAPTGYAPGPYYSGGYPVADPCEMPYSQTQGHPGYGVGPNQVHLLATVLLTVARIALCSHSILIKASCHVTSC